MKPENIPPADAAETGSPGVFQLKRPWSRGMRQRQGLPLSKRAVEGHLKHAVLDGLGVVKQALQHLFQTGPSSAELEQWIVTTTGGVSSDQIARITAMQMHEACPSEVTPSTLPPLMRLGRAAQPLFDALGHEDGVRAAPGPLVRSCGYDADFEPRLGKPAGECAVVPG